MIKKTVPVSCSVYSKIAGNLFSLIRYKLIFLLAILLISCSTVFSATVTTAGNGNWNSATNNAPWPGGVVPASTDIVIIAHNVTVTAAATCAGVTINSGNTLTINANITLTVNGVVSGAGILSGTTTSPGGIISITGNFNFNGTYNAANRISVTFTGTADQTINSSTTITWRNFTYSKTGNGILTITKTPILINANPTTFGNVNYNGAAQNVYGAIYTNLTLSGSGLKTTLNTVSVNNGILTMEGTATISSVPTYTGTSSLKYNTSTARTAGPEWRTPFTVSGGVIISNTGMITMNNSKVFNAGVPLTIDSGATLSMSTFLLTLNGDLINNGGTANGTTGGVTITGTATQNIGAFTTTGTVSMTKTGGTATFTGNVNGAGLTINGTGGTLNLGTGLTHTFSGNWTRTAGTLNGGSSTLKIGGSVSGTGGIFTAGSGTVEWYAAGQTIAGLTYYNLTLSGSGTKTLTTGITVNGNFTLSGTATTATVAAISIGGNLNIGDGTTFIAAGFALTVTGTTTVGGGTSGTLTISSATGTKAFNGDLTLNTGAILNNTAANAALNFPGNLSSMGTINAGTGVYTLSGTSKTISGTISIPSVTVTGSYTNNGIFTVSTALNGAGSLTNGALGSLHLDFNGSVGITTLIANTAGNKVDYGYAGAQTITLTTYYNLSLSGSGTKTFASASTINNDLSINGVIANLGTGLTHNANNLYLGEAGQLSGSWGSTTSSATHKNNTYFVATGIVNVSACPGAVWSGASNTDWNMASNWCGGSVPTAVTNVTILSGSNQPVISSAAVCNNILINTGATLTISGSNTLTISGDWTKSGTFTPNLSTVIFNGVSQSITGITTFNNVTLGGSNIKTFTTGNFTVNGIFSMEETGTVSSAPTYGASATLQYNTATARTAGAEWLSTFTATGGVVITNTGTITMNSAEVFNATAPLTIDSGASLSMATFLLTLNGNLINNGGTANGTTGGVTITGTATQSIGAFTTTGTVSITKTGGTANLNGNVYANSLDFTGANNTTLALNGYLLTLTGGISMPKPTNATITLDIGTGNLSCTTIALGGNNTNANRSTTLSVSTGTITTTGNITSAGTNSFLTFLGSGTLNVGGNFMNASTGTFTASTGTINTTGGSQAIAGVTYNNLTLSGSGTKTTTTITVTGILLIENGVTFAGTSVNIFGDFHNNGGTLGSSPITIEGTSNQSIDSFTTSGAITITKTGGTATITGNISAASISFTAGVNGAMNDTISLSPGAEVTLMGALTIGRPGTAATSGSVFAVNAGSLSCTTIALGGTGVGVTRITTLSLSTGTITVSGNITSAGIYSYFTFTGSGTLNVGGNFMSATPGTFTPSTGTVNINGGAQIIASFLYNHLKLSGSGIKTFATTPTVNDTLSMEGTATITVTTGVVTYGTNATLKYNTGTARTASAEEWITPFAATGGVTIANTGTITMITAKVFNASIPLTINSGATLATGNFQLTLGGNFVNNGGILTAGSTPIVINANMTSQNIAGFTTTGLVTMSKTGGNVTFTGNVQGNGLTINGTTGGTLNLGTGLTHTFTGVITLTAGTLNGGSSILNENATSATAWNGTGTVFSAGTGTVNFGGVAQTLTASATTFNNLTFSNSGTKTLTTANCTVNGILSMEGTAIASAPPTYGSSATLLYNTSTSRTAGPEWMSPFAAIGGVIIANTGTITLNSAKVFNASSPLTLNSGSGLATNNFQLTFAGYFYNNGGTFTAGTGIVLYNGTAQTIANVPYYNLTLSGSGAKTTTGVTVNAVLSMEGSATASAAITYGGSGTLQYNGSGVQTTSNTEFPTSSGPYNLIINNSLGVSLTSDHTLAGNFTNNSGSVFNINPGISLTVQGTTANNATYSGLIIKSDATATGNLIHNNSGVAGTVERYLTGDATNMPMHYISSPVYNASIGNIWQTGDYNIYWYDETNTSANITNSWIRLLGNVTLERGRGYSVVSQYSNRTNNFIGNLTVPTDITNHVDVSYTSSGDTAEDGWNLIGNPYPCALNASSFLSDNTSSFDSGYAAIYYWNDIDGVKNRSEDYATRNIIGGTAATGGNTPNNKIGVGQAFFVKVHSGITSLSLAANQRTTNDSAQFFIPDVLQMQKLWISVTGPNDLYNEALLGFLNGATTGIDQLFDAYKLSGNSNISLYSLIDGNNYGFAIQAIPPITKKAEVKLGLMTGIAGNYTLKLKSTENFDPKMLVILKDLVTGTLTNLRKDSTYQIALNTGEYKSRFILQFFPDEYNRIEEKKATETVRIYTLGNRIYITGKFNTAYPLTITDITGRLVGNYKIKPGQVTEINADGLAGIYFVSVVTEKGIVTKKVLCNIGK